MTTNQRSIKAPQTVVVKLGTSVLTGGTLALDRAHMVELARSVLNSKARSLSSDRDLGRHCGWP